jgi:hypothetical protein
MLVHVPPVLFEPVNSLVVDLGDPLRVIAKVVFDASSSRSHDPNLGREEQRARRLRSDRMSS